MAGRSHAAVTRVVGGVQENQTIGEVAERLNAPVLKTGKVATPSRVRIPVSPPFTPTNI